MSEDSRQSVRFSELEDVLGGKYKIISKIGSGGFGEVFLGEHTQLRRKIAIKILLGSFSSQDDLVKRFQREARSAASLTHPNIIDIYDVGEGGGIYYFVMKYIDGETLAQKMAREKQVAPAEAIYIIRQVADALDYAHANDVVHRDIKPANVMLDAYGNPLLMDFGVARVQFEGNLTKTGTLLGTPHYLAPEQPLGKPIDGRSDIYSLGIMFYEMLAGKPPFHDQNSISLIFKHINEAPTPLQEVVQDLSPDLCKIVHKMIEKLPDSRYQDAGEVAVALQNLAGIYPPPTPGVVRKSTPGTSRNTEKLMLLAHEHLEQEKLDKALEILSAVTRRKPENETAKQQIQQIIAKLIEKCQDHIEKQEFVHARELIAQLNSFVPDDERLADLSGRLDEAEYKGKSAELQMHTIAVQKALQENDAKAAVAHLTSAATINAADPQVGDLMEQTASRITSEINSRCEKLDFTGAEEMLKLGKEAFPDITEKKTISIVRHRELYEKLKKGRELFDAGKYSEAVSIFEDFLKERAEYDYEVFTGLRTQAEDALRQARKKLESAAAAPSVPVTVAASRPTSYKRLAWIIIIGVISIGAVLGLSRYINSRVETAGAQPDLTFLQRLREKSAADMQSADAIKGRLSITSEPQGAKVFLGEEEKGVTPLQVADLDLGKYSLKMQLEGYKEYTQDVELTQEIPSLEVPVTLESNQPVVGTLVVESQPDGAFVVISNRVVGTTPKSLPNTSAGKYVITLKKDGYEDYVETVRVKQDQTATMNAILKEIPKPVAATPPPKPAPPEVRPGMLVTMGPGVTPPRSTKKTAVRYPDSAKGLKISGTVKLNVLVSETGQVIDVKLVASAHPVLDQAAIDGVKEWLYEPARKQGVPVKMWVPTSITFVKR